MSQLTREQILSADDIKVKKIKAPLWGGFVYIKTLTGAERDAFETIYQGSERPMLRAALVCAAVCDKDGNRLFKDEDAVELSTKNAAMLDDIFWVANEFNKITPKDVADLEGN